MLPTALGILVAEIYIKQKLACISVVTVWNLEKRTAKLLEEFQHFKKFQRNTGRCLACSKEFFVTDLFICDLLSGNFHKIVKRGM